jgi:hypothetical protein
MEDVTDALFQDGLLSYKHLDSLIKDHGAVHNSLQELVESGYKASTTEEPWEYMVQNIESKFLPVSVFNFYMNSVDCNIADLDQEIVASAYLNAASSFAEYSINIRDKTEENINVIKGLLRSGLDDAFKEVSNHEFKIIWYDAEKQLYAVGLYNYSTGKVDKEGLFTSASENDIRSMGINNDGERFTANSLGLFDVQDVVAKFDLDIVESW